MLNTLKLLDKATADNLLARTSYYLSGNPIINNFEEIKNEDMLRNNIIQEVCKNLDITPDNKQAIIDYLDNELETSMLLTDDVNNKILLKLSAEAALPTDLYTIKTSDDFAKRYFDNTNYLKETVHNPDLVYNFTVDLPTIVQKDISIFAKYYPNQYHFHSFFLIVIGKRNGLDFIIDQAWKVYNELLTSCQFSNALDLLKIFVDNFGVEVEFRGETSKLFLSEIAKNEQEYIYKIDNTKLDKSKKGQTEVAAFYFIQSLSETNQNFSLFFVIDIQKYKKYLKKHTLQQRCYP